MSETPPEWTFDETELVAVGPGGTVIRGLRSAVVALTALETRNNYLRQLLYEASGAIGVDIPLAQVKPLLDRIHGALLRGDA